MSLRGQPFARSNPKLCGRLLRREVRSSQRHMKLVFSGLDGRSALGFSFFSFLDESLNGFAFLEAVKTSLCTGALEDLLHRFSRQSAVLHPVIYTIFF